MSYLTQKAIVAGLNKFEFTKAIVHIVEVNELGVLVEVEESTDECDENYTLVIVKELARVAHPIPHNYRFVGVDNFHGERFYVFSSLALG